MKPTPLLASIALLAAAASTPLWAADRQGDQPRNPQTATQKQASKEGAARGFDHGMQPVVHDAAAAVPGHGWRYFTDPAARRAVVISPQGDYYYSRGTGLHWVAAEQT